ncbi:MAG: hypothetical protein N2111_03210 [Candidatus Sumerlaeaceae bacterium]|nr:hypothetical protein [Candidatus Sumerlaeaceae bacterium]
MRIGRVFVVVMAVGVALANPAFAAPVTVESGYFADAEFQPLMDADPRVLEREPAAVLVFAADQSAFTALAEFDKWAQRPHRFDFAIYAVVPGREGDTALVVEEILRQRNVRVPIFFTTSADYLAGEPYKLLVLRGGGALQLTRFSLEDLERRMERASEDAGLEPRSLPASDTQTSPGSPPASGDSATTAPRRPPGRKGVYNNSRFGFTVRFPDGWVYRESRSGDGAVGERVAGPSKMDMRVWATPNEFAADGSPGKMTVRDYLTQHIETLGQQEGATVEVEARYVVREGFSEGRDYTYSYTNKDGEKRRGRLQAIEADGVFKVAAVEGPAAEFDRSSSMIEDFIGSFSATR